MGPHNEKTGCSCPRALITRSNLPQSLLKNLGWLTARDQVFVIDDDSRHRTDACLGVKPLALAHLCGKLLAGQNGLRPFAIKPHRLGHLGQQVMGRHILGSAMAGLEQSLLQGSLLSRGALFTGPVKQPMGIKGVPDPPPPFAVELKPHFRSTLPDRLSDLSLLLRGGAVFLCQVFGHILSLGPHLGVELEWLEMDVGGDLGAQTPQRYFQGTKPHRAPGARHIGHEINFERSSHFHMVKPTSAPVCRPSAQDPPLAVALRDNALLDKALFPD
jgi:hypothetical protein